MCVKTEGTEHHQRRQLQQPVLLPQPPTNRMAPAEVQRPEERRTVDTNTECAVTKMDSVLMEPVTLKNGHLILDVVLQEKLR